tara:strand:- start:627 stop:1235 length:609 start_codon:yes stop_codon:yes gene_type:complete
MGTLKTTNIKHASSSSNNIVLNSDGSTTFANISNQVGKIIQVKQTIMTGVFSTESTTWDHISGLDVTIQPASSSNKILIAVNLGIVSSYVNNSYAGFRLVQVNGSSETPLGLGTTATGNRVNVTFAALGFYMSSNGYQGFPASYQILDTPSTTNNLTYKLEAFSGYVPSAGYKIYVNRPGQDVDGTYTQRSSSTMTAMEIAA